MARNKAITNKLDRLEKAVKKKLLSFYNSTIKGSPVPVDILKQQYNQQVKDIIRKTAQDSYLAGSDQVGSKALSKDKSFQLFISQTDLHNISNLTDKLSNDFWNTARRLQDRESAFTDQGVKKAPLDSIAAFTGIAAGLVFSAFNNAIVSKSTQISSTPLTPLVDEFGFPIEGLGVFDPTIDIDITQVPRVRFVTQNDALVDPDICAPLDGTEWFVDDPSIITPPFDTHPHCRCTLEPVIE